MSDTHFRDYQDSDFPYLFALGYDRGEGWLNSDYLRLGDSAFEVPPTSISVRQRTRSHVEEVPRSPGGIVLASGFSQAEVVIELMFTDVQDIYGLRPDQYTVGHGSLHSDDIRRAGSQKQYLASPEVNPSSLAAIIAQFKRTPIMPVVNDFLNNVHHIDALAMCSIMVETRLDTDGRPIPNMLVATIVANAYEVQAMCPSIVNLDLAIIWPLQRWFWRQEWAEILPGEWRNLSKGGQGSVSYPTLENGQLKHVQSLPTNENFVSHNYPHLDGSMSAKFEFSLVSNQWVQNLIKLRQEFARLTNYTYSAAFKELSQTQQINYNGNLSEFAAVIAGHTGADSARMEPRSLGDGIILMHISASLDNNFAPLQIAHFKNPTYQHMSQGDVRLTATFWATSDVALSGFQSLIDDARELIRDSRFELVSGFIGFENEVASLFNCHAVIFTDIQARNIEGIPDNYLITVDMVGFNRHQRKLEALKQSSDPSNFLAQDIMPISTHDDKISESQSYSNKFWARYFNDQEAETVENPAYNGANPFTKAGRPLNAWFNSAYIQQAKEQMSHLELYPDLRLPTLNRVIAAIENGEIFKDPAEKIAQSLLQTSRNQIWNQGGTYVDPDFYVDYPNSRSGVSLDGLNEGNPASYLSLFASHAQKLPGPKTYEDVSTVVNIDGSYKNVVISIGGDEHIPASVNGPDPRDEVASDSAISSDDKIQHGVGIEHADQGIEHNRRVRHATMNFPNKDPNSTSIMQVPHKLPATTLNYAGKNTTFHGDDVYHKIGIDEQIKYLQDQQVIDQHQKYIYGDPSAASADDKVSMLNHAIMAHHPVDVGGSNSSELARLMGSLTDVIEFDTSGRLVQSFPTYLLQIIDEGPRLGWVQLFPNFYAIQAVQSIDIIQDRRDPAHTATLQVMNMYGNLSSVSQLYHDMSSIATITDYGGKIIEGVLTGFSHVVQGATGALSSSAVGDKAKADAFNGQVNDGVEHILQGVLQPIRNVLPAANIFGTSIADEVADLRSQKRNQMMLRPGVRLHIRMGYGSNAAAFPVLFNGRVTEIGYGERMSIVAQGDGIELTKLIPTAESETNTLNPPSQVRGPFVVTGFEPRHLICMMLSSHNQSIFDYSFSAVLTNAWRNFWWKVTDGSVFADNPIGIMHFGNPFLFNFYDWDSQGVDGDATTYDYSKGPKALSSFTIAKGMADPKKSISPLDQFWADSKKPYSQADQQAKTQALFSNAQQFMIDSHKPYSQADEQAKTAALFKNINKVLGGPLGAVVVNTGNATDDALTQLSRGLGGDSSQDSHSFGIFAKAICGAFATLADQDIPSGYGETGENVYPIYSPFQRFMSEFGSAFAKHSNDILFNINSKVNQEGWAAALNDAATKAALAPDPPNMTPMSDVGALHLPGVSFNMYTHNKTVWEVIEFMSQGFPPYIAAVRPFEYRSTLFFGSPYFQYRYDYARLTSEEIAKQDDESKDKYFGYPYGYKTKPFMQIHYFDSRMNLISNNVRASDEETFTDVIALWYKGQGGGDTRPTPAPVKQTVDKQIMPALRKTAIVNTDYVGCDVPPTGAAVLGGLGTPELTYLVKSIHIPFTEIGINGGINYFVMEENMRKTARAILRDYQRLMYQGRFLVLGDPTLKPFDIVYMNDQYNHMDGMCGVRRAIWHFSFDTGFVTSVEPDLLCEVKGDVYLSSIWGWAGAYVGANLAGYFGSRLALVYARKNFNYAVKTFFLKLEKSKGAIKGISKIGFKGFRFANQRIEKFTQGRLTGKVRELLLERLHDLMGKKQVAGPSKNIFKTYTEFHDFLLDTFKNSRALLGKNMQEEIVISELQTKFDTILADAIKVNTNDFIDAILQSIRSGLGRTFAGIEGNEAATISVERAVRLLASETMVIKAGERFIGKAEGLFDLGRTAKSFGTLFKFTTLLGKVAIEKLLKKTGSTVSREALKELLLPAMGAAVAGPLGLAVGIALEIVTSVLFTQVSRWWDDGYSLNMVFLRYRGQELSAGLTGHRPALVIQAQADSDVDLNVTPEEVQNMANKGTIGPISSIKAMSQYDTGNNNLTDPNAVDPSNFNFQPPVNQIPGEASSPAAPVKTGKIYTKAEREVIAARITWGNYGYSLDNNGIAQQAQFCDPAVVTNNLVQVMDTLSSMFKLGINAVAGGGHAPGSYHYRGQAIDIGSIDGMQVGDIVNDPTLRLIRLALSDTFPQGFIVEVLTQQNYVNSIAKPPTFTGLYGKDPGAGHVHIAVRADQ